MIIKNGLLMDPDSGFSGIADIRIQDGLITETGENLPEHPGEETVDASGLTVAPGLVDTHVHFRDPGFTYKETIHTGALAAAKGGFTSVICMANTSPVIDSVPVLTQNLEKAEMEAVHVYQAASVSIGLKGMELTDMAALKSAGACGFTDDGIPLRDGAFLYKAMKKAGELDVPISLMKRILHLSKTMGSTTVRSQSSSGSMVLLPLRKNRSWQETVCWRFSPARIPSSSTSAPAALWRSSGCTKHSAQNFTPRQHRTISL